MSGKVRVLSEMGKIIRFRGEGRVRGDRGSGKRGRGLRDRRKE